MKRLTLFFRKTEDGRTRTVRLNIPEPVENIDPSELQSDMQQLKNLNVVPEGFEPDEARLTETNVEIIVNLLE
ncbi:DUF2922 domain-containing protein [Fervidobacterium thailandense]|uniref:DUF2922 domain-containing protein n=1 Tax=Fervidobacterium thailandense TaxID=1008305 RepID=A0A1E3G4H9_9BACT|nr:DUF2922 domain-containing protein [Fervidobacterium thailandense]ODN31139.1 hypothetical protein A4H02_02415 [Fervidobacterium thailandense]